MDKQSMFCCNCGNFFNGYQTEECPSCGSYNVITEKELNKFQKEEKQNG